VEFVDVACFPAKTVWSTLFEAATYLLQGAQAGHGALVQMLSAMSKQTR
jgi:hypothetical protein